MIALKVKVIAVKEEVIVNESMFADKDVILKGRLDKVADVMLAKQRQIISSIYCSISASCQIDGESSCQRWRW